MSLLILVLQWDNSMTPAPALGAVVLQHGTRLTELSKGSQPRSQKCLW